ncbi:hypothetical protein [Leucobacter sp.]
MSQHLNVYSQKGCIDCKPCEGGAANIGRTWSLVGLAAVTGLLFLLVPLFYKKCQFCGHRSWWNSHTIPAQQYGISPAPATVPTQ